MSQGLTLSILRLQVAWGLHAHSHQVVTVFHLVEVFMSVKWLRNCVHQILLSKYFREELKQRMGAERRSLSQEGLIGFCWEINMHNAILRNCGGQTLSFHQALCLQGLPW